MKKIPLSLTLGSICVILYVGFSVLFKLLSYDVYLTDTGDSGLAFDMIYAFVNLPGIWMFDLLRFDMLASTVGVDAVSSLINTVIYFVAGFILGKIFGKRTEAHNSVNSDIKISKASSFVFSFVIIIFGFGILLFADSITSVSLASDCDKIEINYRKQACYGDLAKKTNDVSLCLKASDNYWLKEQCFLEAADTVAKCEVMQSPLRQECIAKVTKDVKICDAINPADYSNQPALSDGSWGDDFKDGCYYRMSYMLKDQSICSKIQTAYTRQSCFGVQP